MPNPKPSAKSLTLDPNDDNDNALSIGVGKGKCFEPRLFCRLNLRSTRAYRAELYRGIRFQGFWFSRVSSETIQVIVPGSVKNKINMIVTKIMNVIKIMFVTKIMIVTQGIRPTTRKQRCHAKT